jgi:hypothetical protein
LIAFLDRSDSYHLIFKRLFASPPALVTSALVIAEGHGWFLRRYDRHRAAQFLAFLEALPALTIQAFDGAELSKIHRALTKYIVTEIRTRAFDSPRCSTTALRLDGVGIGPVKITYGATDRRRQ